MKKLNVQYTKRYYKTITKEVEVPDEVDPKDVNDWLYDNSLELFEDDITDKNLSLEEDVIEVLNDYEEENEREEITNKINGIIEKYGDFTIADVEADSSPIVEGKSNLSHLMEEFTVDGGRVYVYDPTSHISEEIDKYDADFEDLSLTQLKYVLELAEKWEEIEGEE